MTLSAISLLVLVAIMSASLGGIIGSRRMRGLDFFRRRVTVCLRSFLNDKASKAVYGITETAIAKQVTSLEDSIRFHLGDGSSPMDQIGGMAIAKDPATLPPLAIDDVDCIIDQMREQVRLLALAYTKALSDLNARDIQAANSQNWQQSMGDAHDFQTFMMEHFKQQVMGMEGSKLLEVAKAVMLKGK